MGTPHRGADIADWTSYLASGLHIAQFGTGTNRELLAGLKTRSPVLADISRRFTACYQDLKIISLYETRRYNGKMASENKIFVFL